MRINRQDLYGDVMLWLKNQLRILYTRRQVEVFDTSKCKLSSLLQRADLRGTLPGSDAFEIQVPITALLRRGKRTELAFVQCKARPITLKDLGPFLAYSQLATPTLALLLSPAGLSAALNLLLTTYNRLDLLEYGAGKRVKVAAWDTARKQVDPASIFPPGELG